MKNIIALTIIASALCFAAGEKNSSLPVAKDNTETLVSQENKQINLILEEIEKQDATKAKELRKLRKNNLEEFNREISEFKNENSKLFEEDFAPKPRGEGRQYGQNRHNLTPDEMIEMARVKDPELAKELEALKDNPKEFMEKIRELKMGDTPRNQEKSPADGQNGNRGRQGEAGMNNLKQRYADRNAEFIEWLEINYPEPAAKVKNAFEANPDSAFKDTMHIWGVYRGIFEMEKRNPDLALLMKKDLELKDRRDAVLDELACCSDEKKATTLKAELKDLVSARFDIIVEKRRLKFEELNARIQELQKEIQKEQKDLDSLNERRNEIISERVNEIISEKKKQAISWN